MPARLGRVLSHDPLRKITIDNFAQCRYRRLKNWTAFSCFFAAALVLNVPRFRRFPVLGFFLREYNRYFPPFSFLIIDD